MSLRLRLVLTVLALLVLGLVAAAVATFGVTRHYLLARVDEQLLTAAGGVEPRLERNGGQTRLPTGEDPLWRELSDRFGGPSLIELRDESGTRRQSSGPPDAPTVPAALPRPGTAAGAHRFSNLNAAGGDWRLCVVRLADGEILVIGARTAPIDALQHQLALIELVVTVLTLAAVTLLGLRLVRIGMRPLDDIEETAGTIARGDLTRRIPARSAGTEVGRLGVALNAMLTQIEATVQRQEETERRLRRFLADASHELRTPVATIRGYAELFRRGAAQRPDDLARAMSRIESEAGRMSVLLEEMLMLARLDQGRPLTLTRVDLLALAAEAVAAARVVDPERAWRLDGRAATVDGDELRLRDLLDNLLANVRQHTPAGTPVCVSVHPDGDLAVLEVRDRGPGLPPGPPEQVFERFFRGETGRAPGQTGAGLGLSIVAALARAHGGTVTAADRPAGGAVFRVTLPLAPADPTPPAEDGDELLPPPPGGPRPSALEGA